MARKKKPSPKNRMAFPVHFLRPVLSGLYRALPVLLLVMVTVLCFFGVRRYLYADSSLVLTNLRLLTDGDYTAEQVFRQANIQSGTHIFSVNLKQMAARLELDPRIKKAQVKRELPNTLLVDLKIRKPVALVQIPPNEESFLVDRDGIFLVPSAEELAQSFVLIIDGSSFGFKVLPGVMHLSPGLQQAFSAIDFTEQMEAPQCGKLSRIEVDRLGNVLLFFDSSVEVKLGNGNLSENLKKMPHAFKILLEEGIKIEAVKYLDLRFDDIIIKKK